MRILKNWTEKRQVNWDSQVEDLEKECKKVGIFDDDGNIKDEFQAAYNKGKRGAHRL